MKPGRARVTDHAVIRYLERVYGVDIETLRKRIARNAAGGRDKAPCTLVAEGVRYVLSKNGSVISVHGGGSKLSNRARRWRKRRQ
ncbi:hypothetical protein [Roseobacter sp. S98]|uniref:hypothetical protein n=1 Tax=Roseobacter algicola (ex Choi et al. 2025) (nom. illeg.) TaxID=3092138 RepID=UPI0035C77C08